MYKFIVKDAWDLLRNYCQQDYRDKAIMQITYDFALRVSEVQRLTLDSIGQDFSSLKVERSKGSVSKCYPMLPTTREALELYLQVRPDCEHQELFIEKNKPMSRRAIQRRWELYRDDIGASDLGIHCLRHSRAVHALEAGLDIADVQDLLGHKNIQNTMIYAYLTDKRRNAYFQVLKEAA